ncbi:MAG TPA: hypothetical protein VFF53_06580 [Geobacteraceae bacterium]|nr:hypothetical protein [Geobacteraceae bacterium]
MMRKTMAGLVLMMLCSGCVAARTGVPSGEDGSLGKITVDRSLVQSGGAIGDELVVTAGRYGGAVITIDKGKADAISLYLPRGGMEAYALHLKKLVEWGETARQEKIDTVKSVGSVSCQAEPSDGPAVIGTRFISSHGGQSWLGQTRLCQLYPDAAATVTGNPCERDATFYLRPAAARKLIDLFERRLAVPVR